MNHKLPTEPQGQNIRVMILLLLLPVIVSCQWKGGPDVTSTATPSATQPAEASAWVPVPVRMRLFPGGALVDNQTQRQLKVRVELLDAMGDAVKASGQYQIELLADFRLGESLTGQSVAKWDLVVHTQQDHQQRYDSITRTYQLILNLTSEVRTDGPLLLVVQFTPIQGNRHISRAVLDQNQLTPVD